VIAVVRFAEERDLPRVNELRRQVSELHAAGRPDIFKPGFPQGLQDYAYTLLRGEESGILVAERGGVICGMAAIEYLHKQDSPYSYERRSYHVIEFGVDEAYRRQGVGRELMDFMEADARAKGFSSIELDLWAFNGSARAFYEALGFHTYRLLMERDLREEP
jgi:ribosomal protein S18 acetylase RimI-like enzyme